MAETPSAAPSDPGRQLPSETSGTEGAALPNQRSSKHLSRRALIRTLVAASAAGGVMLVGRRGPVAAPDSTLATGPVRLLAGTRPAKAYTLAGTDGWVSMPVGAKAMPPYFPDSFAPPNGNKTGDPRQDLATTYAFGFRNVSQYNPPTAKGKSPGLLVNNAKNHVQISAPLLYAQAGQDLRLTLFNLGMGNRPDLFDSHTIHFHGFANQVAYFDGVPDASLSVPPNQSLNYQYLPADAGTYMYHCHVEDVEHVQMGMNGMVFIAPMLGLNYAYEDASTRFDRQFSLHLSEIFPQGHFGDAHIQDTDWTDFTGYFRLMNGRAWPDTIQPHAGDYPTGAPGDPDAVMTATGQALVDATRLRYQPLSSLIQGESGEYVLVRVSSLGYEQHSLVLPGLPMTVIGQDAKFLGAGRSGYYGDYQYAATDPLNPQRVPDPKRGNVETQTNRVDIGPGESRDLLIGPLPNVSAMTVFPFYDREFGYLNGSDATAGYGGMRTEVHVHPKKGLTRPGAAELNLLRLGQDASTWDLHGNVVNNFTGTGAATAYADGRPVVQAFPGKLYQAK